MSFRGAPWRSFYSKPSDTAILHCTSAYPTPLDQVNLFIMTDMLDDEMGITYRGGLSDHTQGYMAAVCAVAAGACIIEKHIGFEMWREKSHDGGFYSSPSQFAEMVEKIREAETVMGEVKYGPTDSESTEFRRRLCWAKDLHGGIVVRNDVLVVCGAEGLLADQLDNILGREIGWCVAAGTPIEMEHLAPIPVLSN